MYAINIAPSPVIARGSLGANDGRPSLRACEAIQSPYLHLDCFASSQ